MGPYYLFEDDCVANFDTHVRQMHHVHCALAVFALNAHLRIFLDLKPMIGFYIN